MCIPPIFTPDKGEALTSCVQFIIILGFCLGHGQSKFQRPKECHQPGDSHDQYEWSITYLR